MNLPPYRRAKGLPFTPPPEISRLPMSLLRTALVTRAPDHAAQGFEEYQERMDQRSEPPMLLPQRVMFQQWKSDLHSDGRNRPKHRDWLSSAESISEAVRASGVPMSTVHRVQPAPVSYDMAAAARDYGGEFPEPPRDLTQPVVVTRDVPAYGRPLQPPQDAFITTLEATGERAEVRRRNDAQRAFAEASAVRAHARRMIFNSDE